MPFAKVEGKAFEVIHGDYVTLTDGTGIVHIAPAYGEDDSLVAKQNGITFVNLVDKSGNFVKEVEPWAGKFVRDCNEDICKWLAKENKLFSKENTCTLILIVGDVIHHFYIIQKKAGLWL